MPAPAVLTIHAAPHPNPEVRQAGFPLDHPYIEQCWSASIGPSCTLLLRRLPVLWREAEPAIVYPTDLSRSLGLGAASARTSRFWKTVERLTDNRLATRPQDDVLEVYATVRPLTRHRVRRLPEWSQQAHHRLLGEHLDRLAAPATARGDAGRPAQVAARLNDLQRPPQAHHLGLGR